MYEGLKFFTYINLLIIFNYINLLIFPQISKIECFLAKIDSKVTILDVCGSPGFTSDWQGSVHFEIATMKTKLNNNN